MKRVLLVRMDKIGDLCLSLPADRMFPSDHVFWFVAQGMDFIPKNSLPPRNYQAFSKTFSWMGFLHFLRTVRGLRPDIAVVFQAPAWVGWALWLARVSNRVGVLSKLSSFLVFNKGVRQKRSISDRHELAYNIDLLKQGLGIEGYSFESIPKLTLKTPSGDLGRWELQNKSYLVVHPGMAGSALNWSPSRYGELIQKIPMDQKVVVTGTAMDRPWVEPIKAQLGSQKNIVWLNEKLGMEDLLLLLSGARAVLAPSTGVIHLASALQTPVLGIYSPRRVETPTRWGPLGKRAEVFVPKVSGQISDSVMNLIEVDDVFSKLERYFV